MKVSEKKIYKVLDELGLRDCPDVKKVMGKLFPAEDGKGEFISPGDLRVGINKYGDKFDVKVYHGDSFVMWIGPGGIYQGTFKNDYEIAEEGTACGGYFKVRKK